MIAIRIFRFALFTVRCKRNRSVVELEQKRSHDANKSICRVKIGGTFIVKVANLHLASLTGRVMLNARKYTNLIYKL